MQNPPKGPRCRHHAHTLKPYQVNAEQRGWNLYRAKANPKSPYQLPEKNVKRAGCGSTAGRNLYRLTQFFSAAVGSQLTTEFALLRQTDAVLMRCYVIQEHRSAARPSVRPHSSLVCLFVLLSCCPFVLLPRKFCPNVFFC